MIMARTGRGIDIEIHWIKELEGQLVFGSSFQRRVNEEYIIPETDDPICKEERLHPCSVVPEYLNGKALIAVYIGRIVNITPVKKEELFEENIRGFEQNVMKRHLDPSRGRMYTSETSWYVDDSPEGLYTTFIFPKYLIGKMVTLVVK
jgi:hypothetical protein